MIRVFVYRYFGDYSSSQFSVIEKLWLIIDWSYFYICILYTIKLLLLYS